MTSNRRFTIALATMIAAGATAISPSIALAQAAASGSEGAFQREFPAAHTLLEAADLNLAHVYAALEAGSHLSADVVAELIGRLEGSPGSNAVAALPQETRAVLAGARDLQRKILDVYSDPRVEDPARIVEDLTDAYLQEGTGRLQAEPKSRAIMRLDPAPVGHGAHHGGEASSPHAAASFASDYPEVNRILWAQLWLENALLEALTATDDPQLRNEAVAKATAKFQRLVKGGEEPLLPSALPTTPAIAPDFTTRHRRASVILNHRHMLEMALLDAFQAPTAEERDGRVAKLTADFTDPELEKVSISDWLRTSLRTGIYFQGGPATREMARSDRNADSMFNQEGHDHVIMQGMPVM